MAATKHLDRIGDYKYVKYEQKGDSEEITLLHPKFISKLQSFVTARNQHPKRDKLNLNMIIECFMVNEINDAYFDNNSRKDFLKLLKERCNITACAGTELWNHIKCHNHSIFPSASQTIIQIPLNQTYMDSVINELVCELQTRNQKLEMENIKLKKRNIALTNKNHHLQIVVAWLLSLFKKSNANNEH
eukprot:459934_1